MSVCLLECNAAGQLERKRSGDMFSKVVMPGESIRLSIQPKQDIVQVIAYITQDQPQDLALYALALDVDGWGVEQGCVSTNPSFPLKNAYMEWLEPSSRDPKGFRTLSLALGRVPDAVLRIAIVMGEMPVNGGALLPLPSNWTKGSVRIRLGIQSWEWLFLGERLLPETLGLNALSFSRMPGGWGLKIEAQCIKPSADAWVKHYVERPIFQDISNQTKENPPHSMVSLLAAHRSSTGVPSSERPERFDPWYEHAKGIRGEYGLTDRSTRYVLVIDRAVLRSNVLMAQCKTILSYMIALSAHTQAQGAVEWIDIGKDLHVGGSCTWDNLDQKIQEAGERVQQSSSDDALRFYGQMMEGVRRHLYPQNNGRDTKVSCQKAQPTLVCCLLAGDANDAVMADWQLRWASYEPLFWQMLALLPDTTVPWRTSQSLMRQGGLGGSWKWLDRLPHAQDRLLVNADYAALGASGRCDVELFYRAILGGYSVWFKEARLREMIIPYSIENE
jgi:vWA found in TerF C terminus